MVSDERALAKMKDEDLILSPFDGIEKGAVLQECRIFNDLQLNTRRCEQVLIRLLYLVGQGDHLSSEEATNVFFSVTKLFQANEPSLRRLVYLAIKELAHTAEEVIIVTNCLTKDINSDVDMYRANATRVLCKITDAQMVQQIERYLKQEIVDRNPVVASAALVSGQQLIMHNKGDVVRRWVNEVTQALDHKSPMVQYHALALLYLIKQHDRLAVSKLVQSMCRQGVRSPMATVLLIRYVARIIADEPPSQVQDAYGEPRPFFGFLEACLKHRSDVVIYEASRAIANLPNVTPTELQHAVSILQRFLVQPKPSLRFAAIRTLNQIASTMPLAVTSCNADMEVLIADHNRSIATLAITTLLRTGSENSIERLLKQIQTFLSDIADEFKVKVVSAIHALCIKYPSKYYALMNFLGNALREEGGFEFKRAIVDAYLGLMDKIPESKETCLSHLCEFIEDCEHTQLSTRILHLLGKEGPSMPEPGKYIRYIYNRLILENATVRAAAVSALSSFAAGSASESLRKSVAVLLRQSLMDSDDEVRDRATFFSKSLGLEAYQKHTGESRNPEEVSKMQEGTKNMLSLPCPIANLEAELLLYVASGNSEQAFDISSVSKAAMMSTAGHPTLETGDATNRQSALGRAQRGRPTPPADLAAEVLKVPDFTSLGRPFKSCPPKDLTEAETEYTAQVIVHLYESHVILEFVCVNTLNDQLLENVFVQVDTSAASGLGGMTIVPAARLAYGEPARNYVSIERTDDGEYPLGDLACTMKFIVKDVDPSTGEPDEEGYEDEYGLDDLPLTISNLMAKPAELPGSFKAAWEALGPDNEVADSFLLEQHDNVASAVKGMMALLGMAPCEGTEVANDRARGHILLMTGVFMPGIQVMLHSKFTVASDGVNLEIVLRSEDLSISEVLANSITGTE
ncbi:Coatomer subunit gamma [Chondrus crispus]|uniref:Coatomer subunit gamma n=1 Tax=Chondrus crispus TaxID=2769 RepID=R7Q9Q4_CHOCR|nr:Coatomer subunit gamma [Chondrus crispus]CDF34210.1 Coatomer subunit gamma [Chondrus crispus]|eukprot:XP_005714029.1 Coatomer subunit gamma [Chondrus crispus]